MRNQSSNVAYLAIEKVQHGRAQGDVVDARILREARHRCLCEDAADGGGKYLSEYIGRKPLEIVQIRLSISKIVKCLAKTFAQVHIDTFCPKDVNLGL